MCRSKAARARHRHRFGEGVEKSIQEYFSSCTPVEKTVLIRGYKEQKITFVSARLHVVAHGKKRFLIALKYEGETEFRYLVATDMTWRTDDILQSFFLRWLIEVFFEDWKGKEMKGGGSWPNIQVKKDLATA